MEKECKNKLELQVMNGGSGSYNIDSNTTMKRLEIQPMIGESGEIGRL